MNTSLVRSQRVLRRGILAAVVFFGISAIARADTVVSVALGPTQFLTGVSSTGLPFETIGVTFNWDTTTQTLFDFQLTSSGPVTGFHSTPTFVLFDNASGSIRLLDFFNAQGDLFQLDYAIHGIFPLLSSTPGTYVTDLDLFCSGFCGGLGGDHFTTGLAVVSPTATPEAGMLPILSPGLAALLICKRKLLVCAVGKPQPVFARNAKRRFRFI
jgi:hypothetical protein